MRQSYDESYSIPTDTYDPTELKRKRQEGEDPFQRPDGYYGPGTPDPAPRVDVSQPGTPVTPATSTPSSPSSPVTATGQIVPSGQTGTPHAPTYAANTSGYNPQNLYQWSQSSSSLGNAAPAAATYTPGALPTTALPTYDAAHLSQYHAPNLAPADRVSNQLLLNILQNPESMSPLVVAQQKEAQKEQALAMREQALAQFQQDAASRRVSDWGGVGANERRTWDDTISTILQGQRQIDQQAAATNLADRLNALAAGQNAMNAIDSRAQSNYQTLLGGQQAQAAENLTANNSQAAAVQYALQRALSQEGLNQVGASSALANWQANTDKSKAEADLTTTKQQLALQQALGLGGLNLNYDQLNEQGRQYDATLGNQKDQFNKTYALDLMNYLNNAEMQRYGLGYNYASLQQQLAALLAGLAQ